MARSPLAYIYKLALWRHERGKRRPFAAAHRSRFHNRVVRRVLKGWVSFEHAAAGN